MRVEPTLRYHHKFRRLKKLVGDIAMESLVAIWGHCQLDQRGEFWKGRDAAYVEEVCEWEGEPGLLYRSLVSTGWIIEDPEGLVIHDWESMNQRIVQNWGLGHREKKMGKPKGSLGLSKAEPKGSQSQAYQQNETNLNLTEGGGAGEGPSRTGQSAKAGTVQTSGPSAVKSTTEGECHSENGKVARHDLAAVLLEHLNAKTGAGFRMNAVATFEITQRLKETNEDVEGIKRMIDRQVALWKDDPGLRNFLRPATLFEERKFHDYYGQRDLPAVPMERAQDREARKRLLEEAIMRSRANRESSYHNQHCTQEEKDKLRAMRKELAAL